MRTMAARKMLCAIGGTSRPMEDRLSEDVMIPAL